MTAKERRECLGTRVTLLGLLWKEHSSCFVGNILVDRENRTKYPLGYCSCTDKWQEGEEKCQIDLRYMQKVESTEGKD